MTADRLIQHFHEIAEAPDAVARLRRFILDLAVRGKLVEQDSTDETVHKIATDIDSHRKEIAQSDRRAEILRQELLHTNLCWEIPSAWLWLGLADIA